MGDKGLPQGWIKVQLNDLVKNPKSDLVDGPFGSNLKSNEYVESGIPVLKIQNIKANRFVEKRLSYVTPEKAAELSRHSFIAGDLMITKLGEPLGLCCEVPSHLKHGIFVADLMRLRPSPEIISSKFLLHAINSVIVQNQFKEITKGTTRQRVNLSIVRDINIELPPLNEQHRIVAKIEELFSELDKGIEYLKTAQAQLKVYRQALLKHAFEGKLTVQWREQRRTKQSVAPAKAGAQPLNDMDSRLPPAFARVTGNDEPLETAADLLKRIQQERAQRYQQQLADWEASGKQGNKPKPPKSLPPLTAEELAELPELPEGWEWVRLEEISEHITDGDHQAPPQTKEGIPFITISDIKNQKIDFSNTRHVSRIYYEGLSVMRKPVKDDILYTVTGSFGISCLIDSNREFCFQRHIGLIRSCKDIDKKFLFYLLSSCQIHNQAASVATGTAQKTVPLGGLRLFKIPIMSHQEQEQIAIELDTRISETDQLDQTITTSLQQAEALRQSILKKAFSGQLVPQDPDDEPASELLARIKAERLVSQSDGIVRHKGGQS